VLAPCSLLGHDLGFAKQLLAREPFGGEEEPAAETQKDQG